MHPNSEQKKPNCHHVQHSGRGRAGLRRQKTKKEEQDKEYKGRGDTSDGEELQAAARSRGSPQNEAGAAAGERRGQGAADGGEDEVDQHAL